MRGRFFLLLILTLILQNCKRSLEPLTKQIGPDTTSHNFIWTADTLPGNVFDISGLDENNVWLAGEFWKNDPQTGKTIKYNFGYWDGNRWSLKTILKSGHYMGIYVFSKNNIWLTDGGMIHWNGKYWKLYHPWNMGILDETEGGVTKVWGLDSSSVFFIGLKGTIIHYNGNTFTKMESGTDIDLTHIYGLDGNHIWVVGDDSGLDGGQSVLLFYNGANWNIKYHRYYEDDTPPENAYKGIWADKDSLILVNVWGYWHESVSTGKGRQEYISILPAGYTRDFFANNKNDIFMVGDFQTIHHFNGVSWKSYIPFDRQNRNNFWTVAYVSKDVVFIGGNEFIYRGYR